MSDLEARIDALIRGELATPFSVLGAHPLASADDSGRVIRAWAPGVDAVAVVLTDGAEPEVRPMGRLRPEGVWALELPDEDGFPAYRLRVERDGATVDLEDPYRFPPTLSAEELASVRVPGQRLDRVLGAHPHTEGDVTGVRFAVWAPGAQRVSVVGDFNEWSPTRHPMRPRGTSGVWELFLPGVRSGQRYKFAIRGAGGRERVKADPLARRAELRPSTASVVEPASDHAWSDHTWIHSRTSRQGPGAPLSIYEVHAPSWRRHPGADARNGDPRWFSWDDLADTLLPWVRDLGFTHVELLPVSEHPLDNSWGYQTTGYFAPTSRLGPPDGLRRFVDRAHALGLGVLLDWVPAHFPGDAHGLGRFTGAPLYEHPDPRRGVHPDWGTYIFDFGRPEVRAFLIASALYWIDEFHLDGLRIDAVASMLYLDYSRDEGAWVPNVHGGREHLEAVSFLRELNDAVHEQHPGAIVIAEESTAWPGVTHPVKRGGLGFDYKWNMGWMHDTLEVFQSDPLFRRGLYQKLTFSIMYAFSERFQLALSHDEVVHMKGSLLRKMPGPAEQKFANLRLLLGYMWTHPGKKLLFMGAELGEWREWDDQGEVDWPLQEVPLHAGVRTWLAALNNLYRDEPALHATDHDGRGFEWIDCHDPDRTVLAFLRWAPEWTECVAVVANLAAVPWTDYRLAVPTAGAWEVLLNSDSDTFAGSGSGPGPSLETTPGQLHGREQWVTLDLPPLSIVILKPVEGSATSDR